MLKVYKSVFYLWYNIKMYENFCDVEDLESRKGYYSVSQYIRNLKVNIDDMIRKEFDYN